MNRLDAKIDWYWGRVNRKGSCGVEKAAKSDTALLSAPVPVLPLHARLGQGKQRTEHVLGHIEAPIGDSRLPLASERQERSCQFCRAKINSPPTPTRQRDLLRRCVKNVPHVGTFNTGFNERTLHRTPQPTCAQQNFHVRPFRGPLVLLHFRAAACPIGFANHGGRGVRSCCEVFPVWIFPRGIGSVWRHEEVARC